MKSVAIVGFASATREEVYKSSADEIWSLNMIHSSANMRRIFPLNITRLFEIHPFWMLKKDWYSIDIDHWDWLTRIKHHYPVYLIEEHPEIHNGVRYPLEAAQGLQYRIKRGEESVSYFTSSFCYMIALAILERVDRLECYGFEMGSDTEYIYQKAGAEFWLGIASQYMEVYIPPQSTLLKSKLYGFDGGQLIPEIIVEEFYTYYLMHQDELALEKLTPEKWINLQMIRGAVKLCEEIQAKGDTISRQVLESYQNIFEAKGKKLSAEINVLNSRAVERKRINGDKDLEELTQAAFTTWEYMYRYDGAYQLTRKFIKLCDLQEVTKDFKNRYKWMEHSRKKEAGQDIGVWQDIEPMILD